MPFPFSISYTKPLRAIITPDNQQQVLDYIQKRLREDKADNVIIDENQVTYKGSTSNWRGALFGSVDRGFFTFKSEDNQWYVVYEIQTRSLFISTSVMSVFMGTFMEIGGQWWVGIIAFLWLFGVNWLMILGRHNGEVTWIVMGIDELICGKEPEVIEENKEDSEKLKSWF